MAERKPMAQSDAEAILLPALQVGALTGTSGLLFGATAGLLRNSPPALFALGSGIQWCALGTTYWASRSFILRAWNTGNGLPSTRDRLSASAIAGGIAGAGVGLLTRGPRNVLPGGLMFSLFGFGGQYIFNMLDKSHTAAANAEPRPNFWQRAAKSKWTPFTVLSDAEYQTMLEEKMFKVDVELALIDDRIKALREQAAATAAITAKSEKQGGEVA